MREWPLAAVLIGMLIGLAVVSANHFKRGAFIIGVSVLGAGALRALLPAHRAGLLAVRGRVLDVVSALLLGLAILVVTLVVPPPR